MRSSILEFLNFVSVTPSMSSSQATSKYELIRKMGPFKNITHLASWKSIQFMKMKPINDYPWKNWRFVKSTVIPSGIKLLYARLTKITISNKYRNCRILLVCLRDLQNFSIVHKPKFNPNKNAYKNIWTSLWDVF